MFQLHHGNRPEIHPKCVCRLTGDKYFRGGDGRDEKFEMFLLHRCIREHLTVQTKGKVERPFRTIKELHETLYHFHTPKNEEEANAWLLNYVLRYNEKEHRAEKHSRIDDWISNLPKAGLREICSWDRYARFAREPERRKVAGDETIKVSGVTYRVDSSLAGQDVIM